ncbi:MAG: hypothetical protein HOP07_09995 [Bacteriovoracaceae bacterium]|nr:hypothetical protein [Bacteriovoracaceae bacterium]
MKTLVKIIAFLIIGLVVGLCVTLFIYGAGIILNKIIGIAPIVGASLFLGSLVLVILMMVGTTISDTYGLASVIRAHDGDDDSSTKIGRNDKCPCGSLKKYKNCCYQV